MALLPVKLPANIGTTLRQQQEQGLCCGGGHHHGCGFSLGVLRVVSRGVDMTFVGCALFTILHVIGLVECSSEKVFSPFAIAKRRSFHKRKWLRSTWPRKTGGGHTRVCLSAA